MRLIDADKLKMTTITRWNGDVDFVVYKEELDNAPTVIAEKQTEPTDGDLISRQAVLDIFGDIHPLDYNARAYVAQIKELPSEKVDGDLISRQAVKDLIRGLTKWSVKSQDRKYENVGLLYDDVMFGIDRLPSAENTAEWIDRDVFDADRWKCSKCGRTEQYRENYCPNCGRRMLGEQTE